MKMSMILLLFLSMPSLLSLITSNETGEFLGITCLNTNTFTSDTGWFQTNSFPESFQSKLNEVLNTLISPAARHRLLQHHGGLKFYGKGLRPLSLPRICLYRRLQRLRDCREHNGSSTLSLPKKCNCMVRPLHATQNATEWNRFNQVLGESMNEVVTEATNTANKFATKQANISRFLSVYSLAQCTWDLSAVWIATGV